MPCHRHCIVPECSNRKDSCKIGSVPGENGVFTKIRLCGSTSTSAANVRQGCGGHSEECKSVSFHRLPADAGLQKQWLAAIPRTNTPTSKDAYVCGQHFVGGRRQGPDDVPSIFVGKKVPHRRESYASTLRLERLTVKSESDASFEEDAVVGAVPPVAPVLVKSIEKGLEEMELRDQVQLLKDRLKEAENAADHCKQALEAAEAKLKDHEFGVEYALKDERVFKFYTGISVRDFHDLRRIIGESAENMNYSRAADSDHEGRRSNLSAKKLSLENELFLTLSKLRHDFPEKIWLLGLISVSRLCQEYFGLGFCACPNHFEKSTSGRRERTSTSTCLMLSRRLTQQRALSSMPLSFHLRNLRTQRSKRQHGQVTKIVTL